MNKRIRGYLICAGVLAGTFYAAWMVLLTQEARDALVLMGSDVASTVRKTREKIESRTGVYVEEAGETQREVERQWEALGF